MTSHLIQIIDEKETVFSAGQLVFEEDMQQFFDMYVTDSLVFLTSQRNDIPITALSLKNYISPQINRAVKNKSYFYNCYGKEEKFYIENQG
ncbi:MAG: hypothetical protein WC126_09360 [Proteiniphilum sp.]